MSWNPTQDPECPSFGCGALETLIIPRARDIVDELRQPLPVRATAAWSRTDGIAHWKGCRLDDGPLTENVAVPSSHVGLVSNPLALAVLDDRLAQDPAAWRPFSWRAALARRTRVAA